MATIEQALKLNIDKESYLQRLHGNSLGWITRATKTPDFKQWHYKIQDLKSLDLTGANTYISLNTFYKPQRRIENIKELNALYIDLDCYNTEFTKNQIIMNLEENYFNKNIPIPNFIIDSGRGLYLIWLINKVPHKALPLWKATEEYLYKQLKDFGADRKALDCTRVLRVPGSINSKSNTRVEVIEENDYVYDLREIQRDFLPELKPKEKKKGRPNKINYIYKERSLYHSRIQDITKLCELRNYNMKGHREEILFLYRYWLCSFTDDIEKALEDTLELNSMFTCPLSEREVIRATRSAERVYKDKNRSYKYKHQTLIDLLDITEEEQKHLQTIISSDEKKRRKRIRDREYQEKKYQDQLKADGKITKKEEIDIRRQKIKDLLAEGLKRKEIYTRLNISLKTYKRDLQFLKEQGLI